MIAWNMPAVLANRPDGAEIKRTVNAAHKGDRKALAELRGLLTETDWQALGNLPDQALCAAAETVSGRSEMLAEAVRHNARAMERDLLGENPGPIERLLVARVVVCWLMAYEADLAYQGWIGDNVTLRAGHFHLHRQEVTQRRLLAAIRALATVRGLIPGALQVNLTTGPQTNLFEPRALRAEGAPGAAGPSGPAPYG